MTWLPERSRAAALAAGWTDERVALAKQLWTLDGLSAGQIAKRLGGVSRNAVIGKLHRLGLTGDGALHRQKASAPSRAPAPMPPSPPRKLRIIGNQAVIEEPAQRAPRAIVAFPDELPGLRTVLTIRASGECRWPSGTPGEADFTLCGDRVEEGSYCPRHARIAYQPSTLSKAKRANDLARAMRRFT